MLAPLYNCAIQSALASYWKWKNFQASWQKRRDKREHQQHPHHFRL